MCLNINTQWGPKDMKEDATKRKFIYDKIDNIIEKYNNYLDNKNKDNLLTFFQECIPIIKCYASLSIINQDFNAIEKTIKNYLYDEQNELTILDYVDYKIMKNIPYFPSMEKLVKNSNILFLNCQKIKVEKIPGDKKILRLNKNNIAVE